MEGKSKILSSKSTPQHETLVNLAPVLGLPENATATRRFMMDSDQNTITITDSLSGLKPKDKITWNLFTPATPTPTDTGFLLSIKKANMQLDLTSPQSIQRLASPADPPPNTQDATNPGITRIHMNATADSEGKIQISAIFKTSR